MFAHEPPASPSAKASNEQEAKEDFTAIYYIVTSAGEKGPFDQEQLKELLALGRITLATSVRSADATDHSATVGEAVARA